METLFSLLLIPIFVGVVSTVIGGILLYKIQNKNQNDKPKDYLQTSTQVPTPKHATSSTASSSKDEGMFGGSIIGDIIILIITNAFACGIVFSASAVGGFPVVCGVLLTVGLMDGLWLVFINQ